MLGAAKYRPIDVRAQLLAGNSTFGGALDVWAVVGGNVAAINPSPD